MGAEEQFVGLCNNNDANHVAKGKRTKRIRPLSPCAVATTAVTSSSSSANSDEHGGATGGYGSFSSTTTIFESTNQEEKDMANCLILLAQGKGGENDGDGNNNKIDSAIAIATTTISKIGFYIYECKTCNKTFPSFQALGGHRASHKKPKVTQEGKKTLPPLSFSPPLITNFEFKEAEETHIKSSLQIPTSLQLGCANNRGNFQGNKSKIHECSICGSEFTSGQALGGHMRRHRASTNTSTSTQAVNMTKGLEISCDAATTAITEVKPRIVLELDLNLPAPEEDIWDSKFQFTATQKSMVLSPATALVGCHY